MCGFVDGARAGNYVEEDLITRNGSESECKKLKNEKITGYTKDDKE